MKKISNINSENRNKAINKNKTFIKIKSIINYRNKFNKLHLFKNNIFLTRNDALDIKSYESTFVTLTTSEKPEMKLQYWTVFWLTLKFQKKGRTLNLVIKIFLERGGSKISPIRYLVYVHYYHKR